MSARKPKSYTAIARSNARRALLQTLYQWQITGADPSEVKLSRLPDPHAKIVDYDYFNSLYHAICQSALALDELLRPHMQRAASSLDPVEHAILWIGTYELNHRPDVHPSVVINEAVELAKHFGAEDSYKMINKVLDHHKKHLQANPPSQPEAEPSEEV